jgi:hypothetical protein
VRNARRQELTKQHNESDGSAEGEAAHSRTVARPPAIYKSGDAVTRALPGRVRPTDERLSSRC